MPNNNLLGAGIFGSLNKKQSPYSNGLLSSIGVPIADNSNAEILNNNFEQKLREQLDFGDSLQQYTNSQTYNVNKWKGALSTPTSSNPIANGINKTADRSGSNFGIGDYAKGGLSLVTGLTQLSDISNSDMTSTQKRIASADSGVNTLAQAASAFGPIGKVAGLGLSLINNIGGSLIGTPKAIKDFSVNDNVATSSAYTGVSSAANDTSANGQFYAKAGLFGKLFGGKKNILNQVNKSNSDQTVASNILAMNKARLDAAASSSPYFASSYSNQINGLNNIWNNGSVMYGQKGGKIISVAESTKVVPQRLSKAYTIDNDITPKVRKYIGDISANNFQKLLNANGNPTITRGKPWFGGSAAFSPFKNNITLNKDNSASWERNNDQSEFDSEEMFFLEDNIKDTFQELAHAKQFKDGIIKPGIKWLTNDLPAYIKGQNPYTIKGTLENEAHSIIEPQMKREYDNQVYLERKEHFSNPSVLKKLILGIYQKGGVIYNPIQKPSIELEDLPDLTTSTKVESSLDRSKISQIVEQRRQVDAQNEELEKNINEIPDTQDITAESNATNISTRTSGADKFNEFENNSLQILQSLNPGKKVEIKFENSGVYNKDGSRDWASQAALLKQGASKTGLSLHNFGAARDYRIVIDGKTISPDNKKLYKDVLWGAAQKTGLHTIGDWDVAHVGLAQEGKGQTWNELATKYPDIFHTDLAKNTIEQLKTSGQTKYLAQLAKPLSIATMQKGGKFKQEKFDVDSVINANLKVPFVDRIVNADRYPVMQNTDGSISTHRMAWASDDQGYFAFPTLTLDSTGESLMKNDNPQDAIKRGDIVRFKTAKEAEEFASGAWEHSKLNKVKLNKDGGSIHIKKKNRGKFTEYKKRTGKTTEEAKHSKDPRVRKMANFAANAKKWKHEEGGILEFKEGGTIKAKSVIVHGKLHAHKHTLKELRELREAEITHKGIPVITKDAEGGVIQHSEVEGRELVLHHELTMKLEELRKDGSDEALVKAGKLLARELMRNTKDKTGTLKSIRDVRKDN